MKAKKKYYVVWNGVTPGVYDNWTECKLQVNGYENPQYKSYPTESEARAAYAAPPLQLTGGGASASRPAVGRAPDWRDVVMPSIAVDAACSGNPGKMEYRGVFVESGTQWFHVGPFQEGTNNIGEFLALVHALALQQKEGLSLPIYSDSYNAILWVKKKKCKTTLEKNRKTALLFDLIARAEAWLRSNSYDTPILKWETAVWGEIPADFGRK